MTIPMVPGPVIPDFGNGRLVQIRDMSGAGRREFGADGDLALADFQPTDVAYDDNHGSLWVADGNDDEGSYGLLRIDDLSDEPGVEGFLESISLDVLAVDSERRRVYFWGFWDVVGLHYLDMESGETSGPVVDEDGLLTELGFGETEVNITGLDVDDDGYIIAAVNVDELDGFDNDAFWVVRIDPDADEDVVADSLAPSELGWESFVPLSMPEVVRDVLVRGDHVYATMAVDIDVDYNKIVRFDSDFSVDSVEGVTLEGDMFLGPQRFLAQRGDGERIVVTDWDGEAANARLLAFEGTGEVEWTVYADGNDPFGFFELFAEAAVG